MLGGYIKTGSVNSGLLSAWSASGSQLWHSVAATSDGLAYNGSLVEPAGTLVLTASGSLNNDLTAVHANTLLALDDGYAFSLQIALENAYHTLVARTDPSGFLSCKDAGSCASKKIDACDDADACTIDWCDAKLGCKHQKFSGDGCP